MSNRRLFIVIAVELLEALQGMCSIWQTVCNSKGWEPEHMSQFVQAQAAIAKAKELLPENPFSAQPKRPNESGSTLCEVRWLVETPAGWLGAYDIEAFEAYKHMIQDDGLIGGLIDAQG